MRRQPDYLANLARIAEWQLRRQNGADPTARLYSADRAAGPVLPTPVPYTSSARRELSGAVSAGVLERVRRGVYFPVTERTGDRIQDREQVVMRIVRGLVDVSRADICFSHTTAALLHGCWLYRAPDLVHVTYSGKPKGNAADDGVRRHRATLTARDRSTVDVLPVTSLERTVVDCACTVPFAAAVVLATSAFRRGADPGVVGALLAERRGARGISAARAVIAAVDPGCASPGEVLAHLAARSARPEGLVTQIRVVTRRGTYWVDSGWPEHKIGIEFHGAMKYSGGVFGEPALRTEQRAVRAQSLMEEGWRLVDLEWDDVVDQERLELTLREVLLRRRQ